MLYNFLANEYVQLVFQLLVAEGIFLLNVPRKEHFGIRITVGILLELVLAFLLDAPVKHRAEPYFFITIVIMFYLSFALLSAIPVCLGFKLEKIETIFVLSGGYATQHIIFSAQRIILHLLGLSYGAYKNWPFLIVTRYLIFVAGAWIIYQVIIKKRSYKNGLRNSDQRITVLACVVVAAAIGLSAFSVKYEGTTAGELICPAYSFLCCIMVLYMEYYVLRENNMKHEKELMEQVIQVTAAQQKSTQEAIDIINIKCHDLKHQIRMLETRADDTDMAEYIKEIRDAVSIYDAVYHSGCKALDYVLREKTLLFNEKGVEFSCILEGKMLDFISSADIYALMGNALDNALERVLKEVPEERTISLVIRHQHEMVLLHLENRCSEELRFEDGLPVTDKEDKNRHGFGVKSMKYIVEKYHGEMFMTLRDGKFCLDILFPIKLEKK